MPQTVVGLRQNQWLGEGQLADTAARRIEGALQNWVAGAAVPFGRVVVRNAQNQAVLPSAAATASVPILGVSVMAERYGVSLATLTATPSGNLQQAGTIAEGAIVYPAGVQVEVLTFGDIVMQTEEAITVDDVGDPVFYRFAGGTAPNNVAGRVRKSAVASEAEALPNAKFVTTAPAGGFVVVRVGAIAGTTAIY